MKQNVLSAGATSGVGGGRFAVTNEVACQGDWFRVSLNGEELVATAHGDKGAALRKSAETWFASDDSVLAFQSHSGDHTRSVESSTSLAVWTYDQIAHQLVNGYWESQGYEWHVWNVGADGSITVNLTALTADGQALARAALAAWSEIIGVNFVEVNTGGEITFDDNESGAYVDTGWFGNTMTSAHVNISTEWLINYGTSLNSYSYMTYLHEIGHALGLGHAGNYDSSADYATDALYLNDAWSTTIMSYFSQAENTYFADQGFTHQWVLSPMAADIIAMSLTYGLSTTTRTGDTVYGFGSTAGRDVFDATLYPNVAYTIFDSGGVDTLNYSGYSANQVINLNELTFSNVGTGVGNVMIARGTLIENAVGGGGNDTIIGNSSNNALTGGAGADILYGGDGNDMLSADSPISFDNGTTADQLYGGAGDDMIFAGYGDIVDGGDGFDTVALSYIGADHGIIGDTAILHKGEPLVPGAGTIQNVERFSDIALTQYDDKMVIGDQHHPATVRSWDGDDHLTGQQVSITMYAGNGNDLLVGSTADDVLYGENGNDKLIGYFGADELWGGEGSDTFYFTELDTAIDRIMDFERGADKIDMTAIDADTSTPGHQAFTFIGDASFTGEAGQLRVYQDGSHYFVAGDVDGDGDVDLLINLGSVRVGSEDFIL